MTEAPTILVIEDEESIRFSIVAYLEDSGFACTEAENGQKGLELFEQSQPQLVITDLRMPTMDGFGVLASIRDRSPETPVVVMTGTGNGNAADEVKSMGARACLFKPLYDMTVLTDLIRSILNPES